MLERISDDSDSESEPEFVEAEINIDDDVDASDITEYKELMDSIATSQ